MARRGVSLGSVCRNRFGRPSLECLLRRGGNALERIPQSTWVSILSDLLSWTVRRTGRNFSVEIKRLDSTLRTFLLQSINETREGLRLPRLPNWDSPTSQFDLMCLAGKFSLSLAEAMATQSNSKTRMGWIKGCLSDAKFRHNSVYSPAYDECLDRLLGLNERRVKRALARSHPYQNAEIYLDSPPEDLFTPYRILWALFRELRPSREAHFVDLGSGLGRIGFFTALFYPKMKYTGFELVEKRHRQAAKTSAELGIQKNIRFHKADLGNLPSPIPSASHYFLFNPFTMPVLRAVLSTIHQIAPRGSTVITVRIGKPPGLINRQTWLRKKIDLPDDSTWPGKGLSLYTIQHSQITRSSS